MNIFTIGWVLLNFLSIIYCKTTKKSNVIAVFSEDDLSGKLPKPESVAAEIPRHLILNESKKLKAEMSSKRQDSGEGRKNSKDRNRNVEDEKVITATKTKKPKSKSKKKNNSDDSDSFDRKSKSMTDHEEGDDIVEPFIVVDSTPISTPVITNIGIPIASIVTVTETANNAESIQIAKIYATSQSNSQETFTVPPQTIRQFTPRSRMNVNRANSNATPHQSFDFKMILAISFVTLFIINI